MKSISSRSSLRRLGAALLLVLLVVASTALLAGRGGGKSEGDVEALLDRAFRQSIERADVKIEAQLSLDGLKGFERPIRLEAAGPYIGGGRALPRLDIDLKIGAQGAGQTVEFGVLRTGDRAFVKFGGQFYEQPRAEVQRANRELGSAGGRRNGSLRELGLDPRKWVVGAKEEGVEKVGGVKARHVSGALDTRSLFRDLNRLVERSANAIGGARADTPDPLSGQEIDRLGGIVRSPSFDIYVGEADDAIRRLSTTLEVRVPEEDRPRVGGLTGGSLRFSIELVDLDGEQQVRAPVSSRPIADLTKQLAGLSALGGLGVLGSGKTEDAGGQSTTPAPPVDPRERAAPPGSPAPEAGAGPGPGVDALSRYADCLDRAEPGDTRALSRCRELLR